MNTYQYAHGFRSNIPAQVAGEELDTLREKYDGVLTTGTIVAEARSEASPLHPAFTWDDAEAAQHYRETQANYLVRSIVIVYKNGDEDRTVRAYTSLIIKGTEDDKGVRKFELAVPDEGSDEEPVPSRRAYVHITDAMSDEKMRQGVLDKAMAEIKSWRRRYAEYQEFSKLFEQIDQFDTVPMLVVVGE